MKKYFLKLFEHISFQTEFFWKKYSKIFGIGFGIFLKTIFRKFFGKMIFPSSSESKFFGKKIFLKLFWKKTFFWKKKWFFVHFWIFLKKKYIFLWKIIISVQIFLKNNFLPNFFLKNKAWIFLNKNFLQTEFFLAKRIKIFSQRSFLKKIPYFCENFCFWKKRFWNFITLKWILKFFWKCVFWKIPFVEQNTFLKIFEVIFFGNNIFGTKYYSK